MANVTNQLVDVYQDGHCQQTTLFSLKNTTAGDTFDLAAWFSVVKRAGVISSTGSTIAQISTIATGVNGGPTLCTVPAGPSQDGVWILAVGVSA